VVVDLVYRERERERERGERERGIFVFGYRLKQREEPDFIGEKGSAGSSIKATRLFKDPSVFQKKKNVLFLVFFTSLFD
jgi:hypothetical protein